VVKINAVKINVGKINDCDVRPQKDWCFSNRNL
jgi:hypothetical protein